METQKIPDSLENPRDGEARKDTDEQCPVFSLIHENERLMAENERLRQAQSALVWSAHRWRSRYLASLETLDRAKRVIACRAVPIHGES